MYMDWNGLGAEVYRISLGAKHGGTAPDSVLEMSLEVWLRSHPHHFLDK